MELDARLLIGALQAIDTGGLLNQFFQLLVGHRRQIGHRFLTGIDRRHEDLSGTAENLVDDLLSRLVGALREIGDDAGRHIDLFDHHPILLGRVLAIASD